MKFTHLHVHSHYSLLDGLAKIDDLVREATRLEMDSLALTDHGNLYGAIEFYKKTKAKGINPILGVEMYTAYEGMRDKRPGIDSKRFHITLLATNYEGYKNLIKIVSAAHLEGFYYKPRVDKEFLRGHAKGIIALSGCLAGEIPRAIQSKRIGEAERTISEYQDIFGKDNFYLEIAPHFTIPAQRMVNDALVELSAKTGAKIVATADIHYIKPEDAEAQDIMVSIQTGANVGDEDRLSMRESNLSMRSGQEMATLFPSHPEAIAATQEIAARVAIEIPLGTWTFPKLDIPTGQTYESELRRIAYEGIEKRGIEKDAPTLERLEYELDTITQKGFAPYFLVVADLLRYAHENGILTNIRGSVAGSLVTYLTEITNIDPREYKLPFERFLNPERPSPPDIDMDFADNRRDEMIEYTKKKYGEDKVAQIGTFGTMMARAVVRDVTRALGEPYSLGDRIAKLIPLGMQGFPMTIDQAIETSPELKEMYISEPEVKNVIDKAKRLEGCVRHISVHAAGVVITPDPLVEYVPLQFDPKGGKIITQYDMHAVDDVGLLKFDFLGIRNLSILGDAVRLAKEHRNADVDIEKIPLDDKKTFDLLARGETMGLFQLGGSGMTKYLKDLKPSSIHDINAMVALYRPGPIESIPAYIERKHNPELVRYLDPRMKDILDQSHGVITYQDDVLLIAIKIAGYSWLEADKLRKAMGKKIPAEMRAQKEKFTKGSIENGLSASKAEELWRLIEPFAAYGFNKCVTGDTVLHDATTGKRTTVKELYESKMTPKILSYDSHGKLEPFPMSGMQDNGLKPVYRLKTRRGLVMKATGNHPFLKFNGWANLADLKAGDRIATARIAPTPDAAYQIEDGKLATLGYLLAEGNLCHPNGIYFYSKAADEVSDFLRYALQFSNTRATIDRSKSVSSVYIGKQIQGFPNALFSWIKELGLHGKTALAKHFPAFVYQLNREQLSLLIAKMWQGDGCINSARDGQIFYATSSQSIAETMPHLLLRLGIISTLHEKSFKYRGGVRTGWTINVSRYTNILAFREAIEKNLIGEPKEALQRIAAQHPILNGSRNGGSARGSKDIIPADILPALKETVYASHKSLRTFAKEYGVAARLFWRDQNKVGYLRETIGELATILVSDTLAAIANSDIYWDEVVTIEPAGEEKTYDLTIPETHNFVANDIIVHNSHAASYGRVAYQTAYMKANFPGEYMAAVLTADSGDIEKIAEIVDETKRMGIPVLPPDVNESYAHFTLIKGLDGAPDTIRFGLESVKNVGTNIVRAIIDARAKGGKFASITDFAERVQHKDFNKKSVESLARCGALDSLDERNEILANIDTILNYNRESQKNSEGGQTSLFASTPDTAAVSLHLKKTNPAAKKERLGWEKELLGLYVTEHPLTEYEEKFKQNRALPIRDLNSVKRDTMITVGGLINGIQRITTKTGEPMLFVTLEDLTARTEILVFPKTLARDPAVWQEEKIIMVRGRLSDRDGSPKILCEEAMEIA